MGDRVGALEIRWRSELVIVERHSPSVKSTMALDEPFFVLIELADNAAGWQPEPLFEAVLSEALERGLDVMIEIRR